MSIAVHKQTGTIRFWHLSYYMKDFIHFPDTIILTMLKQPKKWCDS